MSLVCSLWFLVPDWVSMEATLSHVYSESTLLWHPSMRPVAWPPKQGTDLFRSYWTHWGVPHGMGMYRPYDRLERNNTLVLTPKSWSNTVCRETLRLIRGRKGGRTGSVKWHGCGYGSYWYGSMKCNPALPFMVIKAPRVLTGHIRSICLTVRSK